MSKVESFGISREIDEGRRVFIDVVKVDLNRR